MENKSKSFKDLIMWKKAHQFVLDIYKYTGLFPNEEKYCLIQQLRRSSISIPANIAEGFKKRGKLDKIRFYNIAQGSLEESRYYLILANDLKYGDSLRLLQSLEEISKLITRYTKSILTSDF